MTIPVVDDPQVLLRELLKRAAMRWQCEDDSHRDPNPFRRHDLPFLTQHNPTDQPTCAKCGATRQRPRYGFTPCVHEQNPVLCSGCVDWGYGGRP